MSEIAPQDDPRDDELGPYYCSFCRKYKAHPYASQCLDELNCECDCQGGPFETTKS